MAFRSTVLRVRLQPWQLRCLSAAAPVPPVLSAELVVELEQVGGDGRGDLDAAVRCLDRLLAEFAKRGVSGSCDGHQGSREFLARGGGLREGGLGGLGSLHYVEHDLFEIGLPAVQ